MSTISDSSRFADTATVTEAVAVNGPEVAVIVAENEEDVGLCLGGEGRGGEE